jgi:hypothetical protein
MFKKKCSFVQIENKKMENLTEMKRRQSCLEQMTHRASLVSEIELQNIWQKKCELKYSFFYM